MGEITEALRRARQESQGLDTAPPEPGPEPVAPRRLRPEPSAKRDDAVEISREHSGTWPARVVVIDERGAASEYYRHFALRVLRAMKERRARSVLVTSALREEGKTTTACNLALAMASMAGGRPIALVDLDLRRPSVAKSLAITQDHGLEEVLAGGVELAAACTPTRVGSLDVYPVIRPTRQAHELLGGRRFGEVVKDLTRVYDFVIFDSPPALLVPDVPLALAEVDTAVAVARAGVTSRRAFDELIGIVNSQNLLGVFLNEAHAPRHKRQYGYYSDDDVEELTA